MSNQTLREQIEAVPLTIIRPDGLVGSTTAKLHPSTIDAILAAFTGLPAMQEEIAPMNGLGYVSMEASKAGNRNALRRQILAELEATK